MLSGFPIFRVHNMRLRREVGNFPINSGTTNVTEIVVFQNTTPKIYYEGTIIGAACDYIRRDQLGMTFTPVK